MLQYTTWANSCHML